MKREKFDIFSVLWTILLHALAIVLLLVLHLNKPVAQAESGVPVMLGNMGNLDTDYEFTEVNSMPAPAPAAVPVPQAPQAEPAITQNLEETVAIESGEKEKPVKPVETPKQPTPEEIRAEQERQAAEQAQNLMANAFGRSSTLMALGLTIVDVIIKNISSRNMMSVMDDMLNCGDTLLRLFSISLLQIYGEILYEGLHLVSYTVNP